MQCERELALRDGLMYFIPSPNGPVEAVRFGITELWDERGARTQRVEEGREAFIALPRGQQWPRVGEQLFLVSKHDQNLALYSEALPLYKKPITITVTIGDENLVLSAGNLECSYDLRGEEAKSEQDTEGNLRRVLSRSGASPFTLGELVVVNHSRHGLGSLFLPVSRLNEIRRLFYQELDALHTREMARPLEEESVPAPLTCPPLPDRSRLTTPEGLYYLDLKHLSDAARRGASLARLLFSVDGSYYLPLSAVMFEQERFFEHLEIVITALESEGILESVRFGLNNIGQIPFFRERQLACWADVYLYLGNSESARSLVESGLNLVGGYLWMERSGGDSLAGPSRAIVDRAITPAFISRSCFRRDSSLLVRGVPPPWLLVCPKRQRRLQGVVEIASPAIFALRWCSSNWWRGKASSLTQASHRVRGGSPIESRWSRPPADAPHPPSLRLTR